MFTSTSRIGAAGLMICVLLAYSSDVARAGLLSANSSGAIPAFTGSQLFDNSFMGSTVTANVDYAVFAPGDFDTAFPGQDPSAGTQYVYAYQIQNVASDVSKLTVGLDGDEPLGTAGYISSDGLTDPTAALFVGDVIKTSVGWDFTYPDVLPTGESSAILIFTSAAAPEWDSATLSASWFDSKNLPSPLPEPATMTLVMIGLGLTGLRARSRM